MRHLALADAPPMSVIGLGTWQFGSREWGYGDDYAEDTAGDIVAASLDAGVSLFDTAELYGLGASERILGAALGDRREDVVIASKYMPVAPLPWVVRRRAAASARRLGVGTMELYQVHQPNPVVPDTVTMTGMGQVQDRGLADEIGVSNYRLSRWRKAEAALGRRVLSNQVRYSLVDRRPERELIPWAEREGRIIMAYSPLAQGLLTGKYDADNPPSGAIRRGNPLFLPENLARAARLIETLREVAAGHDATPAQIALAWTIRHPNVVAIPGASRPAQAEANAAAADLALGEDEVGALTAAAEAFSPVSGLGAYARLARERLPV